MKKSLLIIAMLFASMQLHASHMVSEMNLRLFDQAWFTVTLDNQVFGTPVTRFSVDELEPGTHFLRVTRIEYGYYGQYAHPLVVFNGYIDVPARSRINAMIDRQSRFRINKIFALAPLPVWQAPVCNNPVPVFYGMNDFEFDQLVHTISRLSFESTRMQVAKQAIASNYFTSRQVSDLIRLMTFESGKLDIAKAAYHKTVDQQNYFIINDQFTFESSIMDLNEYIYRS